MSVHIVMFGLTYDCPLRHLQGFGVRVYTVITPTLSRDWSYYHVNGKIDWFLEIPQSSLGY